jgi:hypothetical protein
MENENIDLVDPDKGDQGPQRFPLLEEAAAIWVQNALRIRATPPIPTLIPGCPWQPVVVPANVPKPLVRINTSGGNRTFKLMTNLKIDEKP